MAIGLKNESPSAEATRFQPFVLSLVSLFVYVVFPNVGVAGLSDFVIIPAPIWVHCMRGVVSSLAIKMQALPQ